MLLALVACGGNAAGTRTGAQGTAARSPQLPSAITATRESRSKIAAPAPNAHNLLLQPSRFSHWVQDAGFTLRTDAVGNIFGEVDGTGAPQSADMYTSPIPVVGGKSYTLSLWADPSHFVVGKPVIIATSLDRFTAYGPQFQLSGPPGRFSGTVTIPSGVTAVRMDVSTAGATLPKGQKFVVAQPAFGPASR